MLVLYRLFDAKFHLFLWAVKGEPPPDPETAGIGSPRDWIILNTAEKTISHGQRKHIQGN